MPHSTKGDTKENEKPEPVSPGCSQGINKKILSDKHGIRNAK